MRERTLADIVENFHARGADVAYVHRRGYRISRWSYRQIADLTRNLARELSMRGIGQGDRIFLWGEDCPEWVVSFFACVLLGAVVVPMDRTASAEFARQVCRQVDAKLRIGSREQPEIDPSIPLLSFEEFSELRAHPFSAPLPLPEMRSQDTAEIVFTSGTTADPKGVVLSHRNILANLEPLEREIGKYLKYERIFHPLRFLNLLPLSHVFGQFLGLFIPQILGSTVIFQDTLNPGEIIRTIKREKVSVLVTVPRVLDTIRDKVERDLESSGMMDAFQRQFLAASKEHFIRRWWRFRQIHGQFGWKFWAFISGGASLSADSEKFWSRLGFAVIQGYGLTETTSLISLNHPFRLSKGSIGKVLPGREIKLAANGEILVRGESVAKSYFQGQEIKPVTGDEGWFHTGDVGALDESGNLFFKGRRKNVIVSPEGMNIYPEDLETALRRQPEVKDCVVIGLERDGNADACAVLILHCEDRRPDLVVQRANASLAEFQRIRRWLVWPHEDFPRTSTQKPQIRAIREFADSQFFEGPKQAPGSGVLAELITRVTGRSAENLSGETNLAKDLNLNSIERVELLSVLEDRFQLDLDESKFTAASTVGDLEKMLGRPVRRQSGYHYPRWAQSAAISILRVLAYYLLVWPATFLMAYPRVRGRENLEDLQGPLLFASNHVTQVDIGFILAALPFRFRHRLAVAMIGEMLQEMRCPPPGTGFIRRWTEIASYALVVALFNVFPLPQRSGFRESFAFAGESADRGWSLLVFPEGKRTLDGGLNPFQAGIGILAINLEAPVVPIRIDGLFELKKKNRKFARPGSVRVSIGKPVRYGTGKSASEIAADLEARMQLLAS
jgi:long-chain acyl-CoA synthetase